MYIEIPTCKRCCFCIPARYGLLVYAYIKLVILLLWILEVMVLVAYFSRHPQYLDAEDVFRVVLNCILLLGNTLFNILVIVACHMKNRRLLGLYIKCEIGAFIANVLNFIINICILSYHIGYFAPYGFWKDVILLVILNVILIAIQAYILLVVKSKRDRMKNGENFRFVNIAADAEAECNYGNTDEKELHDVIREVNDNTKRHNDSCHNDINQDQETKLEALK